MNKLKYVYLTVYTYFIKHDYTIDNKGYICKINTTKVIHYLKSIYTVL